MSRFRDKSADSHCTYKSSVLLNSVNSKFDSVDANWCSGSEIKSNANNTKVQNGNSANLNKEMLVSAISNLKLSRPLSFIDDDSVNFQKRIDKLNLKFYVETERYLSNQHDMGKCQDQLFTILFMQISLYNDELQRLNLRIFELNSADTRLHNNVSSQLKELELKIQEKSINEEALKSEINSLKQQVMHMKHKLQNDLKKAGNSNDFNTLSIFSNQAPPQKMGSSDKIINLSDSKSNNLIMHKQALSMSNYLRLKQEGNSSNKKSDAEGESSITNPVIEMNVKSEPYNLFKNTEVESGNPESAPKLMNKAKKRNLSDNYPQAHLKKLPKEQVRPLERNDIQSNIVSSFDSKKDTPNFSTKVTVNI